MGESADDRKSDDDLARDLRLFEVCRQFRTDWESDRHRSIEELLRNLPDGDIPYALEQLIVIEYELRKRGAKRPTEEEYLDRFPEHVEIVQRVFAEFTHDHPPRRSGEPESDGDGELIVGSAAVMEEPAEFPVRLLERYEFIRKLGGGTLGLVAQYHDTTMQCDVAVKTVE